MKFTQTSDILTLSEVSIIEQAVADKNIDLLQSLILTPHKVAQSDQEAYKAECINHALYSYVEQTRSLQNSFDLEFLSKLIFLDTNFDALPKPTPGKPLNNEDVEKLTKAMVLPEKRINDLISFFAEAKDIDMVLTLINFPQGFSFGDKTKEVSKQINIGLSKDYLSQRGACAIGLNKFGSNDFEVDDKLKSDIRSAVKKGSYLDLIHTIENVSHSVDSQKRELMIHNRFRIGYNECLKLGNPNFAGYLIRDYYQDHSTPKDPSQVSTSRLTGKSTAVFL